MTSVTRFLVACLLAAWLVPTLPLHAQAPPTQTTVVSAMEVSVTYPADWSMTLDDDFPLRFDLSAPSDAVTLRVVNMPLETEATLGLPSSPRLAAQQYINTYLGGRATDYQTERVGQIEVAAFRYTTSGGGLGMVLAVPFNSRRYLVGLAEYTDAAQEETLLAIAASLRQATNAELIAERRAVDVDTPSASQRVVTPLFIAELPTNYEATISDVPLLGDLFQLTAGTYLYFETETDAPMTIAISRASAPELSANLNALAGFDLGMNALTGATADRRDVAIDDRPATVLDGIMPPLGNLYRVAVRTEAGAILIIEGSRSVLPISDADRAVLHGIAASIEGSRDFPPIASTYGASVDDDALNALVAPKLTLDSYLFGSIYQSTRANAYRYAGTAGEAVTFAVQGYQDFDPQLVVVNPAGEIIGRGNRQERISLTLPTTGDYRMVVYQAEGDGGYLVAVMSGLERDDAYLDSLADGSLTATNQDTIERGSLSLGDTVTGTLSYTTDHWEFTGSAGDLVILSASSEVVDMYVGLAQTDVAWLGGNDNRDGSTTDAEYRFELPADGSYTVTVTSFEAVADAPYSLTVRLADASDTARTSTLQTVAGTFTANEKHEYPVNASLGDVLVASVVNGSLTACAPEGNQCSWGFEAYEESGIEVLEHPVPTDGQTIVSVSPSSSARDSGEYGSYDLNYRVFSPETDLIPLGEAVAGEAAPFGLQVWFVDMPANAPISIEITDFPDDAYVVVGGYYLDLFEAIRNDSTIVYGGYALQAEVGLPYFSVYVYLNDRDPRLARPFNITVYNLDDYQPSASAGAGASGTVDSTGQLEVVDVESFTVIGLPQLTTAFQEMVATIEAGSVSSLERVSAFGVSVQIPSVWAFNYADDASYAFVEIVPPGYNYSIWVEPPVYLSAFLTLNADTALGDAFLQWNYFALNGPHPVVMTEIGGYPALLTIADQASYPVLVGLVKTPSGFYSITGAVYEGELADALGGIGSVLGSMTLE